MPLDKETAVAHVRECWHEVNEFLGRYPPILLIGGTVISVTTYWKIRAILRRSDRPWLKRLAGYIMSLSRKLPFVEKQIAAKFVGVKKDIMKSIHKFDSERVFIRELPAVGLSVDEIVSKAAGYDSMGTFDIDGGRVSGTVYTDRKAEHIELLSNIFRTYAYSNPLHPDVFPGVRKMEAEIVRMVADMYNGDKATCGTVTCGGTESIMLACLAYRNRAFANGISDPVMIVPVTAHAAFDKAAQTMNMRIIHIPVDSNNKVDVKAMRRAISSETCMLVGSAPNFPSGSIDDIMGISNLGLMYNIPVHVDACLGGFLVPFMEAAGFEMPLFDFQLPGVTSISCDTHKYGYAPKGSSVVLYRNSDYLHHQYFSVTDWTGGLYATPTFAGSRSGLAIALTWSTLIYFGREQYVQRAKAIVGAARDLAQQISAVPGLKVFGSPDVSVVAFRSDEFNIYAVADKLNHMGWNLNSVQHPDAIHFCMTYNQANAAAVEAFMNDLKKACDEVRAMPNKGGASDTATIYGTASVIPDRSLIDSMTHVFLDACYATPEPSEEF